MTVSWPDDTIRFRRVTLPIRSGSKRRGKNRSGGVAEEEAVIDGGSKLGRSETERDGATVAAGDAGGRPEIGARNDVGRGVRFD